MSKNEQLKKLKEKFLEDRKKSLDEPSVGISELSMYRMNGPIGVEISKKDVKMLIAEKIKRKIIR